MSPTHDRITSWLAEFQRALAGADPALRQDAVADVREHLDAAISELGDDAPDAAVDAVLAEFGTPDEVAASYLAAERLLAGDPARTTSIPTVDAAAATTTELVVAPPAPIAVPGRRARWFGVVRDGGAWAALLYMLLALPLGIAWFTFAVTGISLSLGLLVLIIGIPIAIAFLAMSRGVALIDGRIVEALLGERMPRRARTPWPDSADSWLARTKHWLVDRRTWTSLIYMILMLPLGILYFTVAVTLASTGAGLLLAPFGLAAQLAFDDRAHAAPVSWLVSLLLVPAGLFLLLATLHVARGTGALHGRFAKVMLVGGDGASSRRDPVSAGSSFARAGVLLLAAAVAVGAFTAIAVSVLDGSRTEVDRTFHATGVRTLELDVEAAQVDVRVDPSLDSDEVRIHSTARVIDEVADRDDAAGSLADEDGRVTFTSRCDRWVPISWRGCDGHVVLTVAPESDFALAVGTDTGEIDLDGAFERLIVNADVGAVRGTADARRVSIATDVGEVVVRLGDSVRSADVTTDVGEVTIDAPGTWNVDVSTDVGEQHVTIPTDPTSANRLQVTTDVGDVTIRPAR